MTIRLFSLGFLGIWIVFLISNSIAQDLNPNLPLDHMYSLKSFNMYSLEKEHHRQVYSDGSLNFTFPRPCLSVIDSSQVCPEEYRLKYADKNRDEFIAFRFNLFEELRALEHKTLSTEVGADVTGHKGPVSFYLDARTFTEKREKGDFSSYDREIIDIQDESLTGSVSYVSYSRYIGGLSLDLPFGRLTASREAAHWGPGIFTNLTFNQNAIPFHGYSFTAPLGPFTVTSLYGDLMTGSVIADSANREVYAHRYEWRIGSRFLIGVSEQMVITGDSKPHLFVPIFPLFIAKSFMHESANNGNVSIDLTYRQPGLGLLYGEFLVDDMESPSSLFTQNYRQNKWAVMAGIHLIHDFSTVNTGFIFEYSQVEPWVYTHFTEFPAQAANLDVPLGNPYGPNSRAMVARLYGRRFGEGYAGELYSALQGQVIWKGNDLGSHIFDHYEGGDHFKSKTLVDGVSPVYYVSPILGYSWRYLHFSTQARWVLGEKGAESDQYIVRFGARY